jgi:hypothetical protein
MSFVSILLFGDHLIPLPLNANAFIMEQSFQEGKPIGKVAEPTVPETLVVNINEINNAVLRRLIGEVQSEKENHLHAYNRQHNRHNRGR